MKGTIFSIEEFAVFDGDGIRVNVFFKGCPLRCKWCHNPEGFLPVRQVVHNQNLCRNCGTCKRVCASPEYCILCGKCVVSCPAGAIRISGTEWEAEDLAKRILKLKPVLVQSGGGVTFSGGEVFLQFAFLLEMLSLTAELNRVIETSAYCDRTKFQKVLETVDFVYCDLKLMDCKKHQMYTGVGNQRILGNAEMLMHSGVPHVFRVPLIHGVNTDEENLTQLAAFLSRGPNRQSVELLKYNTMAGAKYAMVGMDYPYDFSQPDDGEIEMAEKILSDCQVSIR